tara:strand:- start:396 stop:1013 length:618 start_codon:yes stop_codon:yes gene_type:complete
MELPSKDKNGSQYLSYSQISTFLKSKEDYYNRYILGEKFEGNEYTDFGSKVGESLEIGIFNNFNETEKNVLSKVTRYDLFEQKTILNYDDFYVIGFIDSCTKDFSKIIDYKTGGIGKEKQYYLEDYFQLQVYALSLRQEYGITPSKATVEFITRGGNLYRGESLYVKDANLISIDIDLSINRLKSVYWFIERVAKEISNYYNLVK